MAFGFRLKISKSAYDKAMKKMSASRRVWHRYNPDPKKRKRGMSLPAGVRDPATNRDRSVIEMFRLQNRKKPGPIFAYLKGNKVTNWTGLKLCDVISRSGSSRRVHVTARCFDGRKYVGSGPGDEMYIRLRPKKGSR